MAGDSAESISDSFTSHDDNLPNDVPNKSSKVKAKAGKKSQHDATRKKARKGSTGKVHHSKAKFAAVSKNSTHRLVKRPSKALIALLARFAFAFPHNPQNQENPQASSERDAATPIPTAQGHSGSSNLGTQEKIANVPEELLESTDEQITKINLEYGLDVDDIIPLPYFLFPFDNMGPHNREFNQMLRMARRLNMRIEMEPVEGYVEAYSRETAAFTTMTKQHQDQIEKLRVNLSSKEEELVKVNEEQQWILDNRRWRFPAHHERAANERLVHLKKKSNTQTKAVRDAQCELEAGLIRGAEFLENALRRDYGTIEMAIIDHEKKRQRQFKRQKCLAMATEAVAVGLREPLEEQDEHTYRAAQQFISATTKHMVERPDELPVVNLTELANDLITKIPDWFAILDLKNSLELARNTTMDRFKELLLIVKNASAESRRELETPAEEKNKKNFNKEYHDPSPDWPTIKQRVRGGWWRCRTGPDATSAELRCRICHPRGLPRRATQPEPAPRTATEDFNVIMDEINKAMTEANNRQQFVLKERLQCEREEIARRRWQREWNRQGGGLQPYDVLYGGDVNAINYRSQSTTSLPTMKKNKKGLVTSMNRPEQLTASPCTSVSNGKAKVSLSPELYRVQTTSGSPSTSKAQGLLSSVKMRAELASSPSSGGIMEALKGVLSPPSGGFMQHLKGVLSHPSGGIMEGLKGVLSPPANKGKKVASFSVQARDQITPSTQSEEILDNFKVIVYPPATNELTKPKDIPSPSSSNTCNQAPSPASSERVFPKSKPKGILVSSSSSANKTSNSDQISPSTPPSGSGGSTSGKPKGILSPGKKGKGKKRVSWQVHV